ncbi:MAG: sensor of ECF-type sigma factor [Nonlabens sp.]|uniref:sensor of ECF-type sigma factor n=1 Tax=Nonlabens sp. TaxID=1888209 RepID=UPI00321C397A
MRYVLLTLILLCSFMVNAQGADGKKDHKSHRKEMRDKIKALSIAHITKELDLTTKEAQKFWPLYNTVKEERDRLEKLKKDLIKKMEGEFETMNEKQAISYVDQMVTLDQKISATNLDYKHDEIIAVIGAKRFLKLKKAEMDFRRKMIREYKDRKRRE